MKKLVLVLTVLFLGCTPNSSVKNFGGTANLDLPECQKLLNATWKEDNLWYLTRPFNELDVPEIYSFKEKSSFEAWEGTYIISESCKR